MSKGLQTDFKLQCIDLFFRRSTEKLFSYFLFAKIIGAFDMLIKCSIPISIDF